MNGTNQQAAEVNKAQSLSELLQDIAGRYEAWRSSLSIPPAPLTGDGWELHEFIDETFGPDPHPLATSLREAVDGALIEKVCNRLLAAGLPDGAAKLKRQYGDGMACLKEGLPVTASPVSEKDKLVVNLALIDLFIVNPMVILCRDLADGFEAQQKVAGNLLAKNGKRMTGLPKIDAIEEALKDVAAEHTGDSIEAKECTHSMDFRSVRWYEYEFSFTASQAACVSKLWEAWESKCPDIGEQTVLEAADCETKRLAHVFRDHPAWDVMIVQGKTKGTRRLQRPQQTKPGQRRSARKSPGRKRP